MATPSGQISLSDVNAELNLSPTALITMNDAAVRTLAGVGGSGTVISMQDLQNKSNRVAIPLTISTNSYNYNVYTNRGPTYSPGTSDITVTINPGVTVGSTSTGTYAFSVPSAFNPGDTVTVVNNGVIQGMGGGGGGGGSGFGSGGAGSGGGAAVFVSRPTIITNNGTLAGGGGGGGGGPYYSSDEGGGPNFAGGGGGGGGAGFNGGGGGSGGTASDGVLLNAPGSPGSPGTSPAGGGGGSAGSIPSGVNTAGGPGGGRGAAGTKGTDRNPDPSGAGGAGGAAGAYIAGNPFVTYPATGTRLGPSS